MIYRILDLIGHCLFAWLLPGKWWFQFVPDMCFVFLLGVSIVQTRTLKPPEFSQERTWLLWLHRFSHTIYFPVLMIFNWKLFVQCLFHVLWDQVTHQEEFQRRSLWKIPQ